MRQIVGQLIKNAENWLLVILGIGVLVLFFNTFSYRASAALFPRLITFVIALLCFWALGGNIRRAFAGRPVKREEVQETSQGLKWHWSVFIMVLYFALIYLVGFIWSTGVFLFIFPIAAGYRRWLPALIVAVVTAIFIEVSFNMFLQIQLPVGVVFK